MRWTRTLPVLMLALLLGGLGKVAAQSPSSSGMFGNRTMGGGLSASSSNFGGSSQGGSMGKMGQSGGSQGSGSSQGGAGMINPSGGGGQTRHSGSFVGANAGQSARRNFVGAAQVNSSGAARSGQGNFGMGGFGGGGSGMGGFGGRRFGNFGFGAGGNNTSTTPPVRTTLTLGFEPSAAPSQKVSLAITEHLKALPALHWQVPVQVQMQGHTAILRGVAETEHDRDLAERVVRLEATVDEVQNQIEVASSAIPKIKNR